MGISNAAFRFGLKSLLFLRRHLNHYLMIFKKSLSQNQDHKFFFYKNDLYLMLHNLCNISNVFFIFH